MKERRRVLLRKPKSDQGRKKKKKEANSMREEKLGKLGEGGSEVGQTH